MRSLCLVAGLLLLTFSSGLSWAQEKVNLKTLKYPDFASLISGAKGKVVVVDLWGFN